jgi:CubicO group peptidase (beta-lactamase class C family)
MIRPTLLALAGCIALAPCVLTAQPDNPVLGGWVSETVFETALHGELTLARQGGGWRATLAGAEAAFGAAGDSVRFAFSEGRGGFRGVAEGDSIRGFWLRPRRESDGQPFASPLVLRRAGAGAWRGTVQPLEDRFTLHLYIFYDAEHRLLAAFRNPQFNSRGGASQFLVLEGPDSLRFAVQPDTTRPPEVRLSAVHSNNPARIRIFWPDLERTLDLTRPTPAQLAASIPRSYEQSPYAYRAPEAIEDGWRTARAAEAGMDEEALAGVVQAIISRSPSERRPVLIHSLLVAHRGRLVLEEYFFGHERDTPHDVRSAGKTFGSVMLGAAMMRGTPISPESRIYDVLAGRGPFANPDPRKGRITLAHLLTHTAGLACNDNDDASPGNEGTMQSQSGEPDWWKYTLDLPMAHDPGARYAYCSANSNLVGAALTAATDTWLPELFDRTVARPLQFGPYHWNLMPTGEGYLGGGAYLRPRDLLKIGQAFLDGGVWNGRRIVDSAWVTASTAPRVDITPATTGLSAEDFPNFYGVGKDGYAWHLNTLTAGGRTWAEYEASGNGGQLLIVVPELELAVVFTGGNYMQGGIWGRWRQEIVADGIIPAITR